MLELQVDRYERDGEDDWEFISDDVRAKFHDIAERRGFLDDLLSTIYEKACIEWDTAVECGDYWYVQGIVSNGSEFFKVDLFYRQDDE